ncbi:MAG: prolyl oligopeptidase family serine peptidase [Flavobacteriales bacterium]|nr:prolyl oligopeptidase family serine peptidase [Flavobacteriales bacterium]
MIEKHFEIEGCNNRKISIDYRYSESSLKMTPIIYVHGYKGFKDWGASNMVADAFANHGFFYLKFNFSHNGVTTENPVDFVDLEAFGNNNFEIELNELGLVIDWLESSELDVDLSRLAVIGHSRGGGITLLRTAQDYRIKKAITWASVCDFKRRFPTELTDWKETGVQYVYNGRTLQMMPLYYQFYDNFEKHIDKLDILENCSSINSPLLIIHGTKDTAVDFCEADEIQSQVNGSKLVKIENAGHTFGAVHPYKNNKLTSELIQVIDASVGFLSDF